MLERPRKLFDASYAQINHTHDVLPPNGKGAVYTRATRLLTAGNGLTGGGDLTADRTFDVVGGTAIQVNANNIDLTAAAIASLAKADTAVQPARQIVSGNGLTGGGDLSADRTLAVGAGTGLVSNANDVALSAGSIASLSLADTSVQPARSVVAGAGLTGGGTLAADRTFDVGAGTGIAVNANDVALSAGSITSLGKADTAVQPARQIISGNGLTGGGDLSADRTLAVGAGAGITVSADAVAFDPNFTGPYLAGNGSTAAPSYAFASEPNSGIMLLAAGIVSLVSGGLEVARYRTDLGLRGLQLIGHIQLGSPLSPAQITANQNDYNPTGIDQVAALRLTSDASWNITGIQTMNLTSRGLYILNVGAQNLVLVNESASSTAAYRFAIGANITIGPNEGVSLIYDTTSARWRCTGKHV